LPPDCANAGHARHLAMTLGADMAGREGVLLTTDADAVVPPDWISRNLAGLRQGAELVCGRAVIGPQDLALIPAHLQTDDALERRLIGLLDEMAWLIDPDPHDPPPRHTEASGASLALRVTSFDRVGGIPPVASGEDRAFAAALWQADGRVRHDPAIVVTVSGRLQGRADRGMAATLRRRMVQQDEFCDEQAGPAQDTQRSLLLRRRARACWRDHLPDRRLAADLGIDPAVLNAALSDTYFGRAWAQIAASSPALQRRRVRFAELPAEIDSALTLLTNLCPQPAMAAQ
jgi:hypothetical protein